MFNPRELDRSDSSSETENSMDFLLGQEKKELCENIESPVEEKDVKRCKYCGRGFQSDQALGGHLRVHSQHHPTKSKPVKSRKRGSREQNPCQEEEEDEEEGNFFGCFSCHERFPSMQLLCRHVRNYHRPKPKGDSPPSNSSNKDSPSLTQPDADIDNQNQGNIDEEVVSPCNDLVKHRSNWSETGKKGPKIDLDNIIDDAEPLRACYGLVHSDDSEMGIRIRKRRRDHQDSEDYSNESDLSTRKMLFGNLNNPIPIPNPKRKRSKKAAKTVHECEICGKVFETGQALGGHKSYHRGMKSDIESLREMLIQTKPKQQQQHPSTLTVLDFDLNIPYHG